MKPAAAEAPVGMIVSSLAKIGGDQGGSQQTGMLDIARSQLIAQQETAKNTARIAEKMKTTSGSSDNAGSIYQ